MSKSPENKRRTPTETIRYVIGSAALTAGLIFMAGEKNNDEAWAASVQNVEQGTIPEPTPIPEEELQEPIMAFSSQVRTFDATGNPTTGVVVAFVHGSETSVLDPNVNLFDLGVSIEPMVNQSGKNIEQQFTPTQYQAVIIGADAQTHWEAIIAEAEASGDFDTATYLKEHYPPTRPLEKAEFKLDNIRSSSGENPIEIRVSLRTNADGNPTAIIEYRYPDYRAQDNTGELQEAGVSAGLFEPITNTVGYNAFENSFTTEFDANDVEPSMKISDGVESLVVSPIITPTQVISGTPESRQAQVSSLEMNRSVSTAALLNELNYSVFDELMAAREDWFLNNIALARAAGTELNLAVAPTALPEGNRRLSALIQGTPNIDKAAIYQVSFNTTKGEKLQVVITGMIPKDKLKIGVIDNQIVVKNLSDSDHLPTITVNGEPYPPEDSTPDNQDPDTETPPDDSTPPDNEAPDKPLPVGSSTYLPSVINKE